MIFEFYPNCYMSVTTLYNKPACHHLAMLHLLSVRLPRGIFVSSLQPVHTAALSIVSLSVLVSISLRLICGRRWVGHGVE